MFDKKEWAKNLFSQETNNRHLDEDEAHIFLQLMSVEGSSREDEFKESIEAEPIYKILVNRLGLIGRTISPSLALWIVVLGLGNIGQCIMLGHAISVMTEHKHLTLNDAVQNCFPRTIPDDAHMHEAWNAQKINGSNAIDNTSLWI